MKSPLILMSVLMLAVTPVSVPAQAVDAVSTADTPVQPTRCGKRGRNVIPNCVLRMDQALKANELSRYCQLRASFYANFPARYLEYRPDHVMMGPVCRATR